MSRTIRITSSVPEHDKVESYNVRLVKTTMPPEPVATGNGKITILKHNICKMGGEGGDLQATAVELAIRNVSGITIASVVFEAVFYNIEGNILDTVEHKTIELQPNTSRAILIRSSLYEFDTIRSYNIRIIRTTTADVEKVQLRRHVIRTTETGEEEVRGIVKNISEVRTDAALIATFYNNKKENIGTKVLVLKDIEPNSIKQFHFMFKPQEGDIVRTYTLNISEIAE